MLRQLFSTALISLSLTAQAQFGYDFSVRHDIYMPLAGAISVNNNQVWDEESYKVPIGFSFLMDGQKIDTLSIVGDVFFCTDTAGTASGFYAIDADLYDRGSYIGGNPVSPLRYKVDGTPGNRIFKYELANAGIYDEYYNYSTADDSMNIQVWLYEGSNTVELRYGPSKLTNTQDYFAITGDPMVGLIRNFKMTDYVFDIMYFLNGDHVKPSLDSTKILNVASGGLYSYPSNGTVYRFEPFTTSVNNLSVLNTASVYPTVCNRNINISVGGQKQVSYKIFTADGKLTGIQGRINGQLQTVKIDALSQGIYIMQLQCEAGYKNTRFIKQ
jgi:hypothetical protein